MTGKISILITAASLFLTGCLTQNQVFVSRAIVTKKPGTIVLSWSPSSGNAQGYKVEESKNGTDFNQIQMVSAPTATITQVPAGAKYYFRIRSYNQAGDSDYSSVISAKLN